MHEIYRMWHKPFILAVATILTVRSSALASSWHKASVRPPWVPPLAPRWRHLDGHGEHSKLLGFKMFESQHFCKNVYIRILKYIAQIGPSQMSKLQVTAFNMYANHGGGYIYMLCKRTEFLQCRTDHLSEPIRSSTREQQDAYLKCLDFPWFFEVFVDQAMWFCFFGRLPDNSMCSSVRLFPMFVLPFASESESWHCRCQQVHLGLLWKPRLRLRRFAVAGISRAKRYECDLVKHGQTRWSNPIFNVPVMGKLTSWSTTETWGNCMSFSN